MVDRQTTASGRRVPGRIADSRRAAARTGPLAHRSGDGRPHSLARGGGDPGRRRGGREGRKAVIVPVRGKELPARIVPMPFVPHRYYRALEANAEPAAPGETSRQEVN